MEDNFDKDFDHLFARDLKAAGANAQPDREEWGGLSARLDKAERQWAWHRWLPWLLLPLLLLSNGWMMVQWRQLRQEISTVQPRVLQGTTPIPGDPVRATVILYDTVYRTVVVTRRVIASSMDTQPTAALQAQEQAKRPTGALEPIQNQIDKAEALQKESPIAQKEVQYLEKETIVDKLEPEKLAAADTLPETRSSKHEAGDLASDTQNSPPDTQNSKLKTRHSPPDTQNSPPETAFDSLLATSQRPSPIQRHRTPLHGRLGASVGPALLLDAYHIQLSRPLVAQLQFEIGLGRHWAIVPAFQYQTFGYETERGFDLRWGMDPPMPPGQEYKLRHVEGSTQAFVPSLSVQYRLWPEKKLSGYLGAGYALRLTRHGRTEYEFVHTGTGLEYQQEHPAGPFYRQHNASVQAGLEYAIRPRLSLWGGIHGLLDPGAARRGFPLAAGLIGVKYSVR